MRVWATFRQATSQSLSVEMVVVVRDNLFLELMLGIGY
jgi:hypothetical protein